MIIRIEKAERPMMRRKFYKDIVFHLAFEKIKPLLGDLDMVSLFASADALTWHLIENQIIDYEFIVLEWEDIKEELANDKDRFLLLTITFVKLCAIRKTHPVAAEIAKAFIPLCQEYEGFNDLLEQLDRKEWSLRKDEKISNILNYELLSIQDERPDLRQAKFVIQDLVNNSMRLSAESIEKILLPLMSTNDIYTHAFDNEVNQLKAKLNIKTESMLPTLQQQTDALNAVANKPTIQAEHYHAGGSEYKDYSKTLNLPLAGAEDANRLISDLKERK